MNINYETTYASESRNHNHIAYSLEIEWNKKL